MDIRRITIFLTSLLATLALSTVPSTAQAKRQHSRRASCLSHSRRHRVGRHKVKHAANSHCVRSGKRHHGTGTGSATTSSVANTPASLSGSLDVGLNAGVVGWGSGMSSRMDQVSSATGLKWIRQEFRWDQIEPQQGVFDFSSYDQFMLLAAQHGVHVLPLLYETPSWAGPASNAIPSDPSSYAAYVAAVVSRYGPHGSFWTQHPTLSSYAIGTFELWNEPYYDNGNNSNYDPAAYAQLVKAAGSAGHAADSSAKFLLEAEMSSAQDHNGNWVWWVDALYQAVPDLNNYFDAVAVHPYGTDLTNVDYPVQGQAYNGYEQIRRIEAIRQQFINHGASSKPFWITEIGWPTNCSNSDRCTNLPGQAANITTVFTYAHTIWKNFLQGLILYGYDDANANSTNSEDNYGLAYNNDTAKPALTVFTANNL